MKKYLLLLFSSILLFACENDEEIEPTSEFDFAHELYAVNEQVQIIDVSKADAFRWDFGDGTTYAGKEPSHAYKEPGTYSVTVVSKTGNKESSFTKKIKIGKYYAYKVQLLQFVDNYWLENGDRLAPSVGNPDVLLKITEQDPNTQKVLFQSNPVPNVQPGNLPLEWPLDNVMLDMKPGTFSFWNVGFNFYDAKTGNRLIAGTDVSPRSSKINYDRATNEGFYQTGWGAPDSGFSLRVNFRIETR